MPITALPAHFDGNQICLDEPFNLKPFTRMIVTILPRPEIDNEHKDWLFLSSQKLEEAYGKNEPDYSSDLLKKVNPDYGRISGSDLECRKQVPLHSTFKV